MQDITISIDQLDALVFDFDGVLTNNRVHLDQYGNEWVSCSRGDGLGFDVLRKLDFPSYILSTEKNPVVAARAKKLKVPAIQGVGNKVEALKKLANEKSYKLDKILYVGNDLNDFKVMQCCGYTACPVDSHPDIKKVAKVVLITRGGEGVVRELLEEVLQLEFIKILYAE